MKIQSINGKDIHIERGVLLQINDSEEMLFYLIKHLPRNLDLIFGQEWLCKNDCGDLR